MSKAESGQMGRAARDEGRGLGHTGEGRGEEHQGNAARHVARDCRWRALLRPQPGWCALVAALALAGIGISAISTAEPAYADRQLKWLFISLLVMLTCILPHPRNVGRATSVLILISVILLTLLILPGIPRWLVTPHHGVRAWIDLHYLMVQPSELAKIVFVLALARYLRHRNSYRTLRGLLVPFGIMFVPLGLILKEPDLGTAILFFPVLFTMLLLAGARLTHLCALGAMAVLAIVLNMVAVYTLPDSMQLLRPHQRDRIKSFLSQVQDDKFIREIAFQQHQSMALIGSGGLWGHKVERSGEMIRANALPEDHNDMIFAVVVNRWGLIGGLATLGLFALLVGSFLAGAARAKDPFMRLAIVGFAALLFTQMTINIGMAVGLSPIIGITLPFLSYGGSSLVATFTMVGLVINFTSVRPVIVARPSFDFDRASPALR